MSKSVLRAALAAWVAFQLAACGGGGDGGDTPSVPVITNTAPVANAGAVQNVVTGSPITLNGSASSDANADPLSYLWTLSTRPAGSAATLANPTSVTPAFTPDLPGTYVATLVVSDGRLSSAPATVTITAAAANVAPVASAGAAQNVVAGTVVTLDGSASSDANGDALTYAWTLTRPAGSGATLSNASSAKPSFTADVAGTYVASLTVNDGQVGSTPATVTVTAAVLNVAPVANAGAAQNVVVGNAVTLDGSASSDANGDALTYAWTLLSRPAGSSASLNGSTSPKPVFTPDVAGSYLASLVVSDGKLSSTAATVSVTAAVLNVAPVANAGAAQNVLVGSSVTLDGSASSDANGDTLSYAWTLTARPAGSSAALSSGSAVKPSFTADRAGTYVATLVVNDGKVNSAPATVAVSATAPNVAPVANAGTPQTVVVGSSVTLDGTASSDANGDALSYSWTLTTRPPGSSASFVDPIAAKPSFITDIVGTYVATMTVNDGQVDSSPARVTVTAVAAPVLTLESRVGPTYVAQSLPYSNGAGIQTANVTLGSTYVVAQFRLSAANGNFTVTGLSATDATGTVVPYFSGLSNGVVVTPPLPFNFSLTSPLTGGKTADLRYTFRIVETGATFSYSVRLTTN